MPRGGVVQPFLLLWLLLCALGLLLLLLLLLLVSLLRRRDKFNTFESSSIAIISLSLPAFDWLILLTDDTSFVSKCCNGCIWWCDGTVIWIKYLPHYYRFIVSGEYIKCKDNKHVHVDHHYLDVVDVCDDQFVHWLNVKWARCGDCSAYHLQLDHRCNRCHWNRYCRWSVVVLVLVLAYVQHHGNWIVDTAHVDRPYHLPYYHCHDISVRMKSKSKSKWSYNNSRVSESQRQSVNELQIRDIQLLYLHRYFFVTMLPNMCCSSERMQQQPLLLTIE